MFMDPRMRKLAAKKVERKPRATFDFVDPGKFRLQAEYERVRRTDGEEAAKEHITRIKEEERAAEREQRLEAAKQAREAEKERLKVEALAYEAQRKEEMASNRHLHRVPCSGHCDSGTHHLVRCKHRLSRTSERRCRWLSGGTGGSLLPRATRRRWTGLPRAPRQGPGSR